jgi:uncharacterized protein YndB with AHSA1/START domain
MGAARNLVTEPADRVLKIERVFDAPCDLIFKAWTEPEHMMKWFGPRGFKSTVEKHDLRPGGQYRIHMLGPDGDHWSQGVFREIHPPKRLVMVGSWADAQGNPTRPETTLTLFVRRSRRQDQADVAQRDFRIDHCARLASGRMEQRSRLSR